MWKLDFISKEDFKNHVANTIEKYDETLKSIDLTEKFQGKGTGE